MLKTRTPAVLPLFPAIGRLQAEIATLREQNEPLQAVVDEMTESSARISIPDDDLPKTQAKLEARNDALAEASRRRRMAVQEARSAMAIKDNVNDFAVQAKSATRSAVQRVNRVVAKMGQLETAANEIANFSGVISTSPDQTNLLALNATIEAARSGEADKGFVVVAGEVKALARRALESTEDMRTKIKSVQSSTNDTIESVTLLERRSRESERPEDRDLQRRQLRDQRRGKGRRECRQQGRRSILRARAEGNPMFASAPGGRPHGSLLSALLLRTVRTNSLLRYSAGRYNAARYRRALGSPSRHRRWPELENDICKGCRAI